jgi:hypothetical protein
MLQVLSVTVTGTKEMTQVSKPHTPAARLPTAERASSTTGLTANHTSSIICFLLEQLKHCMAIKWQMPLLTCQIIN